MTELYAAAVEKVTSSDDKDYNDFMARRMVEMAADIIMSYLLLFDATRNDSFTRSANVYLNLAEAEVVKHSEFINRFNPEELAAYKAE